jgi:hypothetical protein
MMPANDHVKLSPRDLDDLISHMAIGSDSGTEVR